MANIPFSYSVSASIPIASLSSTECTEFIFDFTESPIPAGITDLYLHVIFKGTLGNEQDIAVAAGMKNLMEPAHHVFWNLTDMFSLNYHLYTSTQIKASQSFADEVDLDHDGVFNETDIGEPYIEPYLMTFEISYMGESPPADPPYTVARVDNLPPGRHIRLIVLVDDEITGNYVSLTSYDPVDEEPGVDDFIFEGVMNQEVNGIWQAPTPANSLRNVKQHLYAGILQCKPLMVDHETGRRSCSYPDSETIPADLTPYPVDITGP
jgi:hypothetical protein